MPFLQIVLNLPFLLAGFLIKTVFFIKKGFGPVYLKGLGKGIALSSSEKGRRQKVPFHLKNLPHYGKIQCELWWNMIRRLTG
jgi:hypothetical protein